MNIALSAARIFHQQLIIYAVAAGVCYAASMVFTSRYEMMGAVIAICLCYLSGFLGCLYYLVKPFQELRISKFS